MTSHENKEFKSELVINPDVLGTVREGDLMELYTTGAPGERREAPKECRVVLKVMLDRASQRRSAGRKLGTSGHPSNNAYIRVRIVVTLLPEDAWFASSREPQVKRNAYRYYSIIVAVNRSGKRRAAAVSRGRM